MSLLDRFTSKGPDDRELQQRITTLVLDRLTENGNRIRAEDAICGAAVIVAERSVEAAGDYPLRTHALAPGSRVFSDRVNQLLCGDATDGGFARVPGTSVFGLLKAGLNPAAYQPQHFPDLAGIFRAYASGVGQAVEWGQVPLSIPAAHFPRILPLRFGFETRGAVDAILQPVAADRDRALRIAVGALAELLNQVAAVLAPSIGLNLALETINGMAKTAPMTESAFRAAQAAPAKP